MGACLAFQKALSSIELGLALSTAILAPSVLLEQKLPRNYTIPGRIDRVTSLNMTADEVDIILP